MHGGGWWRYIYADENEAKTKVTRSALGRVTGFARPYLRYMLLMLLAIIVSSLLALIPPLLYRDLIDQALPNKDLARLNLLALGLIGIPVLDALIGVGQRWISARVGEGVIADLRKALYAHMQRMSLRFFTHTKTGALMSRLDNDVLGAQRALTSTLLTIATSAFQVVAILVIMLSLNWQLT